MGTTYEIWRGRRLVALQNTVSAREAVLGYLRSLGCSADEIVRVGVDAAAWRGAVYRAVALGSDPDS